MATTVHLPPELLARVDQAARSRQQSRERFVIEALERALDEPVAWPPGFIEQLRRPPSPDLEQASEEMESAIRKGRRSTKNAPL